MLYTIIKINIFKSQNTKKREIKWKAFAGEFWEQAK